MANANMNINSSWFQWFGLALVRRQHRTIIKTDWQRQSFIHDRLSFEPGLHSRSGKGFGWALFLPSPKQQIVVKSKALKAPAYSPTSRA
jgi:hypothetical protein